MKKQFQILAAFISVAIVSCSKQNAEIPETTQKNSEEISTSSSSARPYVDPLTINLEAWYKFDNNLKDATGKSPDGVPTTRGVSYVNDRNGNSKSALSFTGNYGVKLPKIKQQTNTSLSVWLSISDQNYDDPIIYTSGNGPFIDAKKDGGGWGFPVKYHIYGAIKLPGGINPGVEAIYSYPYFWRHFVITYDGNVLKFYINGNFFGSYSFTGSISQAFVEYVLGYYTSGDYTDYWIGLMDDLRFYSRTLSANDVQLLYNQTK